MHELINSSALILRISASCPQALLPYRKQSTTTHTDLPREGRVGDQDHEGYSMLAVSDLEEAYRASEVLLAGKDDPEQIQQAASWLRSRLQKFRCLPVALGSAQSSLAHKLKASAMQIVWSQSPGHRWLVWLVAPSLAQVTLEQRVVCQDVVPNCLASLAHGYVSLYAS